MKKGSVGFLGRAFFLQNWAAKFVGLLPPLVQSNLSKYESLKKAFYLTSLDGTEGDYLEFGVFTGSSMSAAIHFTRRPFLPRKTGAMRYFGFDSFEGFGKLLPAEEAHPFFQDLNFSTSLPMVQKRLNKKARNADSVKLVPGFFENTLKGKHPSDYGIGAAEVVLIDSDTFTSAASVFGFIAPILQEGTILLMDDFFFYKGSSKLGVYGAFLKFQEEHPEWNFRHLWTSGCGGVAYMVCK